MERGKRANIEECFDGQDAVIDFPDFLISVEQPIILLKKKFDNG